MPVHLETTSAISSSVTLLRTSCGVVCSARCACASRFSSSGMRAVLQLGHARQIARAPRLLEFQPRALEFFLDLGRALQRGLLGLPDLLRGRRILSPDPLRVCCSVASRRLRGFVLLFLERFLFDLELNDPPLEPIQRLGLGVDLHADARAGLIDQIDRLVGQLPVGDVAVRQRRCGDDRRIGDLDAVMHLIALLQAAQDRDRVLDAGLIDQHGLEATLERRVLLDVLAVLIERRGAHAMQLAARQRRLEHVAGIHRAFGAARHRPWCAAHR